MSKRKHDGLELENGSRHKKINTHGDAGRFKPDELHGGAEGIKPNASDEEAGTTTTSKPTTKARKDAKKERRDAKIERRRTKREQGEPSAGNPLGNSQDHVPRKKRKTAKEEVKTAKLERKGIMKQQQWEESAVNPPGSGEDQVTWKEKKAAREKKKAAKTEKKVAKDKKKTAKEEKKAANIERSRIKREQEEVSARNPLRNVQDQKTDEMKRDAEIEMKKIKRERNRSIEKSEKDTKEEMRGIKREQKEISMRNPPGSGSNPVYWRERKAVKTGKFKKYNWRVESDKQWAVSDIIGGQMLDLDPIFSLNEEYLLIPCDTAINIYATSTSLLVRRLRISRWDRVSAFAICSDKENQLFIATSSGIVEKWDWVEGQKLEYWNTLTPIHFLATSNPSVTEAVNSLVYTADRKSEKNWFLTVHRLLGGPEASKTDLATLLKYQQAVTSLRVLDNGRILLVTSGSQVTIGTCEKLSPDSLKDLSYVWREIDCPEWITSIDVRLRSYAPPNQKSKNLSTAFHGALDIAVGTLEGKIFIYDDLLANISQNERGPKHGKGKGVSFQQLHWHRTAVLALKWSADGNYLISGGMETVLVLWQLETGHKQVLPHLSAAIESIVVSPSGPFYCVRLSDNSAMILSTSELQPTFSVAGIQFPVSRKAATSLPFTSSVDAPKRKNLPKQNKCFPVMVNPSNPGQLLLAVPSSTTARLTPKIRHCACYLQTFDIASAHQISKQALTRTKDTISNMGPESNLIEEPNVTHMQISHDAKWLATVDEWLPPIKDFALLAFDQAREAEEQLCRLEVYLKMWSWDNQSKSWALNSRVDHPHGSGSKRVLGLASDPSCASFATIGHDYTLRVWKLSVRHYAKRNAGLDGTDVMNWRCRYVTALDELTFVGKGDEQGAQLVYSPDGSVIAAGYRLSSPSTVYLIDSGTGEIQHTLTGLFSGPLLGLGIVDRYLVILSHQLRVWDLVREEISFGFFLRLDELALDKLVATVHLAIDARHETFAVSLPDVRKTPKMAAKIRSQVIIFNPNTNKRRFVAKIPDLITTLLPIGDRKGYYAIDSAAEVRVISSRMSMPSIMRQEQSDQQDFSRGLSNIYGDGKGVKAEAHDVSDEVIPKTAFPHARVVLSGEEDDAVVVSPDKLAEIFDTGSAFTLPPVSELFEQVAELFLQRPTL